MAMNKRVVWVDYAKVLLIYLVTLAHIPVCKPIYDTICTFLIPAFFFLSGYFFSYEKYPRYLPFLRRRLKSLMVPYVSLALLAYVFWLVIGRHVGDDAGSATPWWSPLAATALGYGKEMVQSVPLWFVMALFVMENIFWFVGRCMRHGGFVLLAVLVAIGWINYRFVALPLPFELNPALTCMPFYLFGMMVRRMPRLMPPSWVTFVPGAAAVATAVITNDHVTVLTGRYGYYPLFILGAFGGIYATVTLCRALARWLGDLPAVRFVAKSTLVVCGLHLVAYTLLKGVMVYALGIDIGVLPHSCLPALAFGLAGLLCCLPVYWVMDRYAPWMLGRWTAKGKAGDKA